MNDPTANRAIQNIMRRRKAENRAKSQRRRHCDRAVREMRKKAGINNG